MIGQTLTAVVYVVNFGLAARFSALWFGANEISLAGSLALIGDQVSRRGLISNSDVKGFGTRSVVDIPGRLLKA